MSKRGLVSVTLTWRSTGPDVTTLTDGLDYQMRQWRDCKLIALQACVRWLCYCIVVLLQRGSTQPQTSITPSLRQGHSSSLSKCCFPAIGRNQSCCLCACRELLPEERRLPAIFTSQFASWSLVQELPRTLNDQIISIVLRIWTWVGCYWIFGDGTVLFTLTNLGKFL